MLVALKPAGVLPQTIRDVLVKQFGDLPVWGVVVSEAVDSLYDGLTYEKAVEMHKKEMIFPNGKDIRIVIVADLEVGPPMMLHKV